MKRWALVDCDLFWYFAFPFEDILSMHTDDNFSLLLAEIEASVASAPGDETYCHLLVFFYIPDGGDQTPPPNTRPPGLLFSRSVKFPGGVCFWRCIIMCSASFMPNFILYLVKDIMIHAHPLTNHHTYVTICSQRPSKRQCTAPPVPSTPLPGPSHCGMDRCSLCFGCDTALKDLFVLSCRTIWVWNMNMKSTLSFFHHLWCQWDALLLYFGEQFTSR